MANHQSSCTHVHLLGHHFVSSLMNGVVRDFITRTGLKSGTLLGPLFLEEVMIASSSVRMFIVWYLVLECDKFVSGNMNCVRDCSICVAVISHDRVSVQTYVNLQRRETATCARAAARPASRCVHSHTYFSGSTIAKYAQQMRQCHHLHVSQSTTRPSTTCTHLTQMLLI